jgi:hypothetical protein
MDFTKINYETVEERNLAKMKLKSKKHCQHSYIVHRIVDETTYTIFFEKWIFNRKIHLRCEKCGHIKKVNVDLQTIKAYKIGDRWHGKIED